MDEFLKLPVGIDNFEKIRQNGFYYVDKTSLIEQLFSNWGEVNLFTRPRRFGKTLNMSMLKYFFEIGSDRSLFDGLHICANEKICSEHMGKYPVIFLSLKNAEGLNFDTAKYQMVELIAREAERFPFLAKDTNLSDRDREKYRVLTAFADGHYQMSDDVLYGSLQTLSELLYKHFNQKTVILIDEYDVPLDKAFQHGYYREMVALIRSLFGRALKTNEALAFAVLTGCLRVSKESIFTGLNNFKILSITDSRFDEQFGFTDKEVQKLLADYHLEARFSETKEWYDGYRFGNVDVYCPWDVINHIDRIKDDPNARPEAYWINTSGNDLVKRFVDKANRTTRNEIEQLIAGDAIEKMLRLDLTYDEIDNSIENLWSVLFTTGYLTQTGMTEDGAYRLVIPNREIREVFKLQIQEWFKKSIFSNTEQLTAFWKAFEEGNTDGVEMYLNRIMSNSISVFDIKTGEEKKEISYHNLLVGILTGNADWLVKSNVEAGEGFADIIVETEDPNAGIVVELKYTKDYDEMEQACRAALDQINDRRYQEYLLNDGRKDITLYGIAFCKKRCKAIASGNL
ncbi:AAA family ATPase [Clostridium sp. MCC328]|uniref:AAA family ATPase n=1 Tax=Clostridium sp. MCC328 TaxID=2592642 RepID=UPI001C01FD93|nr:AAA family ATPase [Clostridium sp. MCC328]MBT9821412.1 AAA family ATPase [Clostridium sp. MCC328]